jgi:hypothetical protein
MKPKSLIPRELGHLTESQGNGALANRNQPDAAPKGKSIAPEPQPDLDRAIGEILILLSRRASHATLLEKVEALYRKMFELRRRQRLAPIATISPLPPVASPQSGLRASDLLDLDQAADVPRFVSTGLRLARIRDGRLYRINFRTFASFCRTKLQYTTRYANRLIAAAPLYFALAQAFPSAKPRHETQLRPLVRLKPREVLVAWRCAVRIAAPGRVTEKAVRAAVREILHKFTLTGL